ncbi:MAG: AAA domain-containing protein, partial [Bradymonadaceae bacterium]
MRPTAQRDYDLSELFGVCRRGIEQEINAQRENLKSARLADGLEVFEGYDHDDPMLDGHKAEFVYTFRYKNPIIIEDVPLELPTGAQCSFSRGGMRSNGRVRAHDIDGRTVTVALQMSIGEGEALSGKLIFDLAYLLENLLANIDDVARRCDGEPRRAAALFKFVKGAWDSRDSVPVMPDFLKPLRLNPFQHAAVEHTLGDEHHLIWGPPGTGKTRTLGAAVLARVLSRPNERVIVLAHTNVALDNAIRAIWKNYQ